MGRISMPQGKGSQMHNRRDYEKIGHEVPDNIDQERTEENVTIVDKDLREAYKEIFGGAVERYNEKQKREERKIDDYCTKIENSKNGEKLFYEDVIQWGRKEDFEEDEQLKEKAKSALEKYAKNFEERNPNLKLIGAYIHMDEASPHLHLDYVPVATGYKRGMDTRNSLDKALEQQGIEVRERTRKVKDKETGEEQEVSLKEGRYNNRTMAWKEREREYFGELCREMGLDVEEEQHLGRKQLTVEEYKEAEARMLEPILEKKEIAEKTLSEARRDVLTAQEDINTLKGSKNALEGQINDLEGQIEQNEETIGKQTGIISDQMDKYVEMKDELDGMDGRIKEKSEELAGIEGQIRTQTRSLDSVKANIEYINQRIDEGLTHPSIKVKQTTVTDQKGDLFHQEKTHKEYSVRIKAESLGEANAIKADIEAMYSKQAFKDSLGELYNGTMQRAERERKSILSKAKAESQRMLGDASDRIERADKVLEQRDGILAQAEKEKQSILDKARQTAEEIIQKAQTALNDLKEQIAKLTKRRQTLQAEADKIIHEAEARASKIEADAFKANGLDKLNDKINEKLGIVPLYEVEQAKVRLDNAVSNAREFLSDEDMRAVSNLHAEHFEGKYNMLHAYQRHGDGRDMFIRQLQDSIKQYRELKLKPHTAEQVREQVEKSLERMEHRGVSISR